MILHPASDVGSELGQMTVEYNKRSATRATLRSHDEVARFFGGLDLLPPGLVHLGSWQSGSARRPPARRCLDRAGVQALTRHHHAGLARAQAAPGTPDAPQVPGACGIQDHSGGCREAADASRAARFPARLAW